MTWRHTLAPASTSSKLCSVPASSAMLEATLAMGCILLTRSRGHEVTRSQDDGDELIYRDDNGHRHQHRHEERVGHVWGGSAALLWWGRTWWLTLGNNVHKTQSRHISVVYQKYSASRYLNCGQNTVIYWVRYLAAGWWGVKVRRAQQNPWKARLSSLFVLHVQTIECLILLSNGIAETICIYKRRFTMLIIYLKSFVLLSFSLPTNIPTATKNIQYWCQMF